MEIRVSSAYKIQDLLKNKLIICLLLILIILSSCDCQKSCPNCIAADDFGLLKASVSANFKENNKNFKADNNESSDGKHPNHVVRWETTGYYTNGQNIEIRTQGKWAGVFSFKSDENATICDTLNSSIPKDKFCTYVDTQYIDPITKCEIQGKMLDNASKDGDCWIKNGYGAYILFRKKGDQDPNSTLDVMRNPRSPVIHIGYSDDGYFSLKDHIIQDSTCRPINIESGWEIYVKIYDKFYWDNAGGYQLEFISGVTNLRAGGFFENIRAAVQKILNSNTEAIYKSITSNNNYIELVKALLVLYIVITGLTFLLGMSQNTGTEMVIKVLKIAIIIQLISPSSWSFFYNNLFAIFIEGLNEILAVINSHSGADYNPEHPFATLDAIVVKIFSIYGGPKTRAVLMSSPVGFFWCFFILIVLIVYVILIAYAFVIYLTALIGISVLIILMPILFLGLLFGPLKQTFDNWFTQAISFCMQSIMIFTLVSLFGSIIMNHFYRTLGFTTCCNKVFEINLFPFIYDAQYQWTPGNYSPFTIGWRSKIGSYSFDNKRSVIKVPPDYTKDECRYIDYPYLDPQIDNANCSDENAVGHGYDWEQIQRIQNSENDGIVNWADLFTILLLSVMLYHMRTFVQSLGASIAGASPFQTVMGIAYQGQNTIGHFFQMVTGSIQQVWNKGVPTLINTLEKGATTAMRKVPGGEFALKFTEGAKFLAGAESDLEREYFMKRQFKEIHYAQAMMGYHLGALKFGGDLSDSMGMKLMSKPIGHAWDKYVTKEQPYDFIKGNKMLYASELEKIHDYILGVKQAGPQKDKDDKKARSDLPDNEAFKKEDDKTDDVLRLRGGGELNSDDSPQRAESISSTSSSENLFGEELARQSAMSVALDEEQNMQRSSSIENVREHQLSPEEQLKEENIQQGSEQQLYQQGAQVLEPKLTSEPQEFEKSVQSSTSDSNVDGGLATDIEQPTRAVSQNLFDNDMLSSISTESETTESPMPSQPDPSHQEPNLGIQDTTDSNISQEIGEISFPEENVEFSSAVSETETFSIDPFADLVGDKKTETTNIIDTSPTRTEEDSQDKSKIEQNVGIQDAMMDSKDFSSLSDNPKMTEEAELPVGEVQKENSQELPKEEVPIEPKSGGSIFGDFIEKDDNKTSIHGINQPKAKKDISSKIQQKQGDLSSLKSRLTGLQSEERVKLESEIKDLESEISHLHNQSTDE